MDKDKKYYEAYDDRYKQVHDKSLQWFSDEPSEIVSDIIEKYKITKTAKILEIGCGEGRDAGYLLKNNYNLLATDISTAAVNYCKQCFPERSQSFEVLNCLTDRTNNKYDFIYAISVLHMLVLDEDRNSFYQFIYEQLCDSGVALICTMGNGTEDQNSDITKSPELLKTTHQATGTELYVEKIPCRVIGFNTLYKELKNNNLELIESGITSIEPDFPNIMFAVVKI